jgi:hypothetical protein
MPLRPQRMVQDIKGDGSADCPQVGRLDLLTTLQSPQWQVEIILVAPSGP